MPSCSSCASRSGPGAARSGSPRSPGTARTNRTDIAAGSCGRTARGRSCTPNSGSGSKENRRATSPAARTEVHHHHHHHHHVFPSCRFGVRVRQASCLDSTRTSLKVLNAKLSWFHQAGWRNVLDAHFDDEMIGDKITMAFT